MQSYEGAQPVNLFYLGGLVDPQQVPDATITAADNLYHLPEPGKSIRVPRAIADDIIRKYNVFDLVFFTLDAEFARRHMELKSGQVAVVDLSKLTKEDLLRMLAEKEETSENASAFTGGEDEPAQEPAQEPAPDPVPTPKPNKSKAKEGS